MALLNRKRTLLAKIETTPGTDPTPTGAANAILIKNLTLTPMETTLVSRDLVRPYLGNFSQLPAANYAKIAFECELAGSGTAATAPAYDPLLRSCGMAVTQLAAPVTGTAQAGASSTITLAAGASAVDGFYNGMPVSLTGGTGSGQLRVISGYVGSTKVATVGAAWTTPPDATSAYSISANNVYRPVSTAFESVTMYFAVDGVRHKLTFGRGTVSLAWPLWGIPSLKFQFTGVYSTPTDTADPTVTLTGWQQPLTVNNVNTPQVVIHGYGSAVMSDMSIDFANSVAYRSLVGGSEAVVLTDRRVAGSITVEATTVAAKDWWTSAANATASPFSILHGTVAGNKILVSGPAGQITKPNYSEKDQIVMLQMGLVVQPVSGNDEIVICTH